MIWFSCKKCKKPHSRGENLAGTMVFCDCGEGVVVPWSSTIDEPVVLEAVPVRMTMPAPAETPQPAPRPAPLPAPPSEITHPVRRPHRRYNPAYCLNHDEVPTEHRCDDCKLSFCPACVLPLQGKMLCGACKNFRLSGLARTTRLSTRAVLALIIGLVSGPVSLCLSLIPMTAWLEARGTIGLTIAIALVGGCLPVLGLVTARRALREIDNHPYLGGRSLAMTGAAAGLVGAIWSVTLGAILIYKHGAG
jgi:hypothetical protein